ncbi:MAG: GspH/FimT family pseudopilin [Desulfuromonadaceae bacterium]|nr:GspH/FimT family pseudopilin [Desulfuromonas sp.]MDY0184277.1 GspH/FimT family pseudopilin [Desulfuromonadaceae bacterium]
MNIIRTQSGRGRQAGFTLLEVLIVVAIIGIASAIAIPNIIGWLPNYRLKGAARDLYSNMQKIRTEAVKRNTNIGITFTTVVYPATGGGYMVFIDDGKGGGTSGDGVKHADETMLFQVEMPPGCSLVRASFQSTDTSGYNSRGLPLGGRVGSVDLRNNKSRWYQINLSNAGYPKLKQSSNGSVWE